MKRKKPILKHRLLFSMLALTLLIFVMIYAVLLFGGEIFLWLPGIFLIATILSFHFVNYFYRPFESIIESIETGLNCFRDNDFSISIAEYNLPEFELSVKTYNELASILRQERMELHQRELLLDTVIQSTPMAIILTDEKSNIVYGNIAAKKLMNQNRKLEGQNFLKLVEHLPGELAKATTRKQSGLYSEMVDEEKKVFYLTFEEFILNAQKHNLYLYKNMTNEVNKEELQVWKKVIRLISHELNNSLAPIQSLTRSANKILANKPNEEFLIDIFETIERRSKHLHEFIEKYAKFSRLPDPQVHPVTLNKFVASLEKLTQLKINNQIEREYARFDASQIEQVMINLVKNAKESGSEHSFIDIVLAESKQELLFSVSDKGQGMSEEQLKSSLLPFYTTKSSGSGLGLALCKEIVSAHNGKLKLHNRTDGGLTVAFTIPT